MAFIPDAVYEKGDPRYDNVGIGFFPGEGNNHYWNGIDFLLPGFSILSRGLDLNGQQAAQAQYNNQLALQQQAQAYNSAEADKSRQFEKMMSDTSVQRQMADIKAAGLNPWLAVSGNISGASASAGASAQSSPGSADMANNKIVQAAGLIAMALRIFLAKH